MQVDTEAPTFVKSERDILYATLSLSIIVVLGLIAFAVYYFALRTVRQQSQIPIVTSSFVTQVTPNSPFLLSPNQLVPPGTECTFGTIGKMYVDINGGPTPIVKTCTPNVQGAPTWIAGQLSSNSLSFLSTGGNIRQAIDQLSSQPPGTTVVGGPDMFLSSTYTPSNKNLWKFWRGSDNLVYAQALGNNPAAPVNVTPMADCNSWASDDGTCQWCKNASGGLIYNCCSCANPNIANLVNFPNPQGNGTVNVCSAYGISIDENGKCSASQ